MRLVLASKANAPAAIQGIESMPTRLPLSLVLLCLLPAPITVWGQAQVDPSAGRMAVLVGDEVDPNSPLLERYTFPDVMPRLVSDGLPCNYGLPNRGNYSLRGQSWIGLDYLLWWPQGQNIPVLATGPAGNVVFGRERIDGDVLNGVRLRGEAHRCVPDSTCPRPRLGHGEDPGRVRRSRFSECWPFRPRWRSPATT